MNPLDHSWWNKNMLVWKKHDVQKFEKVIELEALRKSRIDKLKKIEKNK